MKILFDIYHLAEFNWLKNIILNCEYPYDISCVNRGPLAKVISNEIPKSKPIILGDYKNNKGLLSMIFLIILPRIFNLFRLIRRNNYDLIVTTSYQAPIASRLNGKKSILINDDPRRIHFKYIHNFTSIFLSPPIMKQKKGIEIFNALIHWSYLAPNVFTPNSDILKSYNLQPKNYIFIREVSADTTNYRGQNEGLIQSVSTKIDPDITVVFSLEDKSTISLYPKDWILLKEPVNDLFSIMYFSKLVLSSGDSVAREGATLGVPSLYCGIREMPANDIMINKQILFKINSTQIPDYIAKIFNNEINQPDQEDFIKSLTNEWVDVNKLLQNKIDQLL